MVAYQPVQQRNPNRPSDGTLPERRAVQAQAGIDDQGAGFLMI